MPLPIVAPQYAGDFELRAFGESPDAGNGSLSAPSVCLKTILLGNTIVRNLFPNTLINQRLMLGTTLPQRAIGRLGTFYLHNK